MVATTIFGETNPLPDPYNLNAWQRRVERVSQTEDDRNNTWTILNGGYDC
jgi:hypothetical protein